MNLTAEDIIKQSFCEGLKPPENYSVAKWADKYRFLPEMSGPEPGRWRTSRTPYLKEVMECLSPESDYNHVIFQKGSQIGATEAGVNFLMSIMDLAPGPTLAVQPTVPLAKLWSRQRLTPSIENCQQLRGKITANKSRDISNSTLSKQFTGGLMIITGANSAVSLRQMPVKYLFLDEVDAYPEDVDGEGDPCELARRRTSNFNRKKIFECSTPTIADISRIEGQFKNSDQRYYNVPCPHCGGLQVIKWQSIKFEDRNPDTARMVCEHCKSDIPERYKTEMLAAGEWIPENSGADIAGFHLSALYSPLGWYSWNEAVSDHLKALRSTHKRKVWVNTILGETWDESSTSIEGAGLFERREKYTAEVPDPVLVLTAAVDTQDDRLEYTVIGWGCKKESWIISHGAFIGDPGQSEVWENLDDQLMREYNHASGVVMNIGAVCIDAGGHFTDEVYSFCSAREYRRVFPIFGKDGSGRPILGTARRNKKKSVYVFTVGVDTAKETLYSRLKLPDAGPGYIHFPITLDENYFHQLTAEKRVRKFKNGMPRLVWTLPSGRRNEALDLYVYNMATLQILNPNLDLLQNEKLVYKAEYVKGAPAMKKKRGRRVFSKGA